MPVYIDKAQNRMRHMRMSHMIADTPRELEDMARRIGVDLKHFQHGASAPHFDICRAKKLLALGRGAIELGRHSFGTKLQEIKATWPRCADGAWRLGGVRD